MAAVRHRLFFHFFGDYRGDIVSTFFEIDNISNRAFECEFISRSKIIFLLAAF